MTREEIELTIDYLKNIQKEYTIVGENDGYTYPLPEWYALDNAIKALEQEPCEDCISRADALRVAKNEYLRGWHDALCKALNEKYSIHCEEGNFSVIQEETITGLGLSMDCAVGKDVENYIGTIPRVTQQEPNTWSLDDAREDFVFDVYNILDFLPTNDETNQIIEVFDRVTSGIKQEFILDKIKDEIEKTTSRYTISRERGAMGQVEWSDRLIKESEVLEIIDKYKVESEDEE